MSNKKKIGSKPKIILPPYDGARGRHIPENDFNENEMPLPPISEEDQNKVALMFKMAEMSIEPEEYALFYQLYEATAKIIAKSDREDFDDEDTFDEPFEIPRRYQPVQPYTPLKNASDFTLHLKIKMKDVTKPPMWREILIPADFNYLQLHEAIQEVVGLEDDHLWQFNKSAYQDSLIIGLTEGNDDGRYIDDLTNDAEKTPLTMFLQKPGDKLEYVYDFGDDWIFVVELKALLNETSDSPECIKFKCDLNPIEDMGGLPAYLEVREAMMNWDKLTKKQRTKIADQFYFDSPEEFFDFHFEHFINMEEVNEALSDITRE